MQTEQNFTVKRSIIINATAEAIWNVLTNPDIIKQYLFESNVETDWKVGSPISFSRDRLNTTAKPNGKIIKDKGQILEIKKGKLLKFSYWNSGEGYDDLPENYSIITYTIERENDHSLKLTHCREKIPIEFEQKNHERYLPGMLENMKRLAEKQ